MTLKPPAMLTVDLREPDETRPVPGGRSWWTARATSDEVRAGFSRAEFQKAERDRQGPEQLLARVGGVLVELRGLETIES